MLKKTNDVEVNQLLEKLAEVTKQKGIKIEVDNPGKAGAWFFGLGDCCK
ncbi:hypothetical protein ACFLSW_03850 [Candidatus Bipolaricaulota bacterium]